MPDRVRDYLLKRGCADHVMQGGLEGLVSGWESTVSAVVDRTYHPYDEDEYLNDMDGRDILAGVLDAIPDAEAAPFRARINAADARFLASTVPTEECIWGVGNQRKHNWTHERQWWYFRRPASGGLFRS